MVATRADDLGWLLAAFRVCARTHLPGSGRTQLAGVPLTPIKG